MVFAERVNSWTKTWFLVDLEPFPVAEASTLVIFLKITQMSDG